MSRRYASLSTERKNVMAFRLSLVALVLIALVLFLPLAEFTTSIYTKKSGNTFVGDERYQAAMTEVGEVAAQYPGSYIEETVTERTNSKGETTSLVVLQVMQQTRKTGWQLIAGGFDCSWTLLGILLCGVVGVGLALLGVRGTLNTEHRSLPKGACTLRSLGMWLGLAAFLLVPVTFMTATYNFSRQVDLLRNGFDMPNAPAFAAALDRFLYSGAAGEELNGLLGALTFRMEGVLWVLLPFTFTLLLGLILVRHGELAPTLRKGVLYGFVIALCIFILYPFFVMLITGFRTNAESTDMHFLHLLPTNWVWQNVPDIIARGVPRFLLNSIFLSGGATLIAMVCGIPAAYAMARMQFKGKKAFLGFVIMSQMFAPVVLLVGISQLMNTIRLNDTILGLMLINAAFNQAFAIWLLRGTFVSISSEMEQAACIDGCSTVSALVRILLPMAAPGIVTTLIFVFINAWNEYTISTVLISTPINKPITVGITQFSSFNMIEWHYLFASALLATIPVVILFMFIEKHLVSGLTSGGVKG